jgi:hypothetical protein
MAKLCTLALALGIAAGSLGLAISEAHAQATTLPPLMTKASSEPSIIVQQIEIARQEEKKAMAVFEAAAWSDDLTEAHMAATNAYVAIRAARSGIWSIKVRKKFADPVLDLAYDKLDKAWNRSRGPVDHMPPMGPQRAGYLQVSVKQMSEVIAWLDQVLLMWP